MRKVLIIMFSIILFLSGCSKKEDKDSTINDEGNEIIVEKIEQREVVVKNMDGSANVIGTDGNSYPVTRDYKFNDGDEVIVNEDSSLVLIFDSNKDIYFGENTKAKLCIEGTVGKTKTNINLEQGSILCDIKNKLSYDESFTVKANSTNLSVKGTVFSVEIIKDKNGRLYELTEVFDGKVGSVLGESTLAEVEIEKGKCVLIQEDEAEAKYISSNQINASFWNDHNTDLEIINDNSNGNIMMNISIDRISDDTLQNLKKINDLGRNISLFEEIKEENKNEHIHKYTLISSIESTCRTAGSKTYKCDTCDSTYTEALPLAAHNIVSMSEKPATCESGGLTGGKKCSVCGSIFIHQTKTLPLEHNVVIRNGRKICTSCGKDLGEHIIDTTIFNIKNVGAVAGTIKMIADPNHIGTDVNPHINLVYSKDQINWHDFAVNTSYIKGDDIGNTFPVSQVVTLEPSETVYIKAKATNKSLYEDYKNTLCFSCTDSLFSANGSIMWLLDNSGSKIDFSDNDKMTFAGLFRNCDKLTSIDDLVFPNNVCENCYASMFRGCTGLTSLPNNLFPADTLKLGCYSYMFEGCTGLTSLPSNLLSATSLDVSCYSCMFWNCTGLTSLPSDLLSSGSSEERSYQQMFAGCTGLTSLPSGLLPGTVLDDRSCMSMFEGCTGLTSLPSDLFSASVLRESCFQNMFEGCTGLTSLPSGLFSSVTTLRSTCCSNMFAGCTGLTTLPDNLLSQADLGFGAYEEMFAGCTGLQSIPSNLLPATTLTNQCYYRMFAGCIGLSTLPSGLLPATTISDYCYEEMFSGCTGLTSLPSGLLPATNLSTACYEEMFSGCTGLTTLPSGLLPATNLSTACYKKMFSDCTGLTSLPNDILSLIETENDYNTNMFAGCTGLQS